MMKNKLYKIFGLIFLLISFYTIYKIRNEFNESYVYLLLVTTICVSTDIGGFLFGKIFKGPKITKISPNKTYSGVIGSFLLSIFSIYFLLEIKYLNLTIELTQNLLIFIILVSSVSQIGDIIISYFKRRSNIKDTGKIIPGHGGLLDRIDGMVFAFPFSYFLILTNILI
jgi:phosphatidate cytidylyltransferase